MSTVASKQPCVLIEATDFFVGFAKGTTSYQEETFAKSAENLYQQIIEKGNCTLAHSFDEQERKEAISHFYQKYCELKENKQLRERTGLLTTLFLKTLTDFSDSKVTEEQQHHIKRHSTPIILKLRKGKRILTNQKFTEWFTKFLSAHTSLPIVQKQINQYRGLSDVSIDKLILGRAKASSCWFKHYEQGELSIDEIKQLRETLQVMSNSNPHILKGIQRYSKLPDMLVNAKQAAIEDYSDEQAEEDRQKGWDAILKALDYAINIESEKVSPKK